MPTAAQIQAAEAFIKVALRGKAEFARDFDQTLKKLRILRNMAAATSAAVAGIPRVPKPPAQPRQGGVQREAAQQAAAATQRAQQSAAAQAARSFRLFRSELSQTAIRFQVLGSQLKNVAIQFTILGTVAAGALLQAIRVTADFQAKVRLTTTLFGAQSGAVLIWARNFAESIGVADSAILQALNSFQAFFRGMGLGTQEATDLAKQLSILTADLAAATGIGLEEAAARAISALEGQSESLDRFGINLKVAALNEELLARGFKTVAQGASETEKALARIVLIQKALSNQDLLGFAGRDFNTLSGGLRRVSAGFERLQVAVGELASTRAGIFFNNVAQSLSGIAKGLKEAPQLVERLVSGFQTLIALGPGLFALGTAFSVIGVGLTAVLLALSGPIGATAVFGTALVTLAASGGKTASALKQSATDITDALESIVKFLSSGKLESAMEVAMEAMALAFRRVVKELVIDIVEFTARVGVLSGIDSLLELALKFDDKAGRGDSRPAQNLRRDMEAVRSTTRKAAEALEEFFFNLGDGIKKGQERLKEFRSKASFQELLGLIKPATINEVLGLNKLPALENAADRALKERAQRQQAAINAPPAAQEELRLKRELLELANQQLRLERDLAQQADDKGQEVEKIRRENIKELAQLAESIALREQELELIKKRAEFFEDIQKAQEEFEENVVSRIGPFPDAFKDAATRAEAEKEQQRRQGEARAKFKRERDEDLKALEKQLNLEEQRLRDEILRAEDAFEAMEKNPLAKLLLSGKKIINRDDINALGTFQANFARQIFGGGTRPGKEVERLLDKQVKQAEIIKSKLERAVQLFEGWNAFGPWGAPEFD